MTVLCDLGLNLVAHLGETSLRSLCLVLATLIVIRAVRLRSPSQRHAAWTVVLGGMLTLPVLPLVLPPMPLGIALRQPSTPLTAVDSSLPPFAQLAIPAINYRPGLRSGRARSLKSSSLAPPHLGSVPGSGARPFRTVYSRIPLLQASVAERRKRWRRADSACT